MLRYCADIWEYTLAKRMGLPQIKQCVLFIYPDHDNRVHSLENSWDDKAELNYSYRVERVWEMDKERIIKDRLVGLYPLLA